MVSDEWVDSAVQEIEHLRADAEHQEEVLLRMTAIVLRFVKSCEIDGFDHVRRVDVREATTAYTMFNELMKDLEHDGNRK